ncbi:trypsin, partial [Trichinella nativa]
LPICTAKADQAVPDDSICFTAGWGKTESAHVSDVLRIVDVTFFPEQTCITNPSSPFDKETMICTAGYPRKSGTCMGDSGGPLVCFVNEKFVQFGIVSWGYKCGDITVFTKLSRFSSWLEESMNDKENYNPPVPSFPVFPSKIHAMQQMKASFPPLWTFRKPAYLIPNSPSISRILYEFISFKNRQAFLAFYQYFISSAMCVEIDCGLITVEQNPKNRNENSNRIIGGWTAEPHTFPWIVKLEKVQNFQRKFLCGEDNLPSKELRIVGLVFQSKEVCMPYSHSLFDGKTMLCTTGQNNKSGGDSGGPLVCYYNNNSVADRLLEFLEYKLPHIRKSKYTLFYQSLHNSHVEIVHTSVNFSSCFIYVLY